jgi:hypothetical protein
MKFESFGLFRQIRIRVIGGGSSRIGLQAGLFSGGDHGVIGRLALIIIIEEQGA